MVMGETEAETLVRELDDLVAGISLLDIDIRLAEADLKDKRKARRKLVNRRSLMAFVMSEKGRAADESLKDTLPLVLYFGSEADREEFVAIVHEAKPGMIAKRMP